MKSYSKPNGWFFILSFLVCLFFSFQSQAQTYVSGSEATDLLMNKSVEMDISEKQGTVTREKNAICTYFIKSIVRSIENDNQTVENALTAAYTIVSDAYPQDTNTVNAIKDELDTLLRE